MTMKAITFFLAASFSMTAVAVAQTRDALDRTPAAQAGAAESVAVDPSQATPDTSSQTSPRAKDDLFDGTEKFANGASDVTEVNMDGKTLGLVGGRHGASGNLARKMDLVTVHTYSYDKPGMFRMEDVEAFRRKLLDKSWNCFIHTRDKEGSTDLCSRTAADKETNELVIITVEPKELTFVHTRGRASIDDLQKVGGTLGGGEDSVQNRHKGKPGTP